jgi:hypothetical protein
MLVDKTGWLVLLLTHYNMIKTHPSKVWPYQAVFKETVEQFIRMVATTPEKTLNGLINFGISKDNFRTSRSFSIDFSSNFRNFEK